MELSVWSSLLCPANLLEFEAEAASWLSFQPSLFFCLLRLWEEPGQRVPV